MNWRSVWSLDFEYATEGLEEPRPLCLVAHDLVGGQRIRKWIDAKRPGKCPYPVGPDDLILTYNASAEVGCHQALGWEIPERIVDLFVEFKRHVCGKSVPDGKGQLGALAYFQLPAGIAKEEKKTWQMLAAAGGPFTKEQREGLLDYCEGDVEALTRLWRRMEKEIDLPRALIRGQFVACTCQINRNGIPVDKAKWSELVEKMPSIKPALIEEVDRQYGVYENGKFSEAKFAALIDGRGIKWPLTPTGKYSTSADAFRDMCKAHPEFRNLHELRHTISSLRLASLNVGKDGRNRAEPRPFGSVTSRNTPSNTEFIFGPACWIRHLIRPEPGRALASIDYEQQEFGIAAAMSGDKNMQAAYEASDPYIQFAIMAGAAPVGATKATHPEVRAKFKTCALGVQYMMGPALLASRIGQAEIYGRELLGQHKKTFPKFWQWVDDCATTARARQRATSTFGWSMWITADTSSMTLANWPCQTNGAEMLRLAVIGMISRGIFINATIHDAVLIEADEDKIDEAVASAREVMEEASRVVLNGFTIRTEPHIIRPGARYEDDRGADMWAKIGCLLQNNMSHGEHQHVSP